MLKDSLYYGKILLFGEYGIIEDSMGLSIPYSDYNGKFLISKESNPESRKSNRQLYSFYQNLVELKASNSLPCSLDLIAFEKDLKNNIYFDSSIPQGFGIGSSGAIVAATYDRYCNKNKIDSAKDIHNESIIKLKSIFSKLESFYHGTSSGLDPLICYLNLPILIKSKTDLGTV